MEAAADTVGGSVEPGDAVEAVAAAVDALTAMLPGRPDVLVTLGSGLAGVAERVADPVDVELGSVPGMPVSRVPGHSPRLRYGRLGRRTVLAQMGRVHLYEGHAPAAVTRMVSVAAGLGCDTFVVTNAAGGLEPSFRPGDVMIIADHLNLTGVSPLTGVIRDGTPLFVDMAGAYDAELRRLVRDVASDRGLTVREGVYAGLPGPAYETPAEVAMLRTLGAQAVGMSTVLEVVAARAHGLRVLGLSSITNVHGAGVATSHAEVLEVGARAAQDVGHLLLDVFERLPA